MIETGAARPSAGFPGADEQPSRRAEGRAVSAVLGITSVGLHGNASASAGRGILNQSAVAEGVGVQRGVFAELLGGLGEVAEQLGGQENVREDDFGAVLNQGRFDRGERQIALVTAGRRGAFGEVGDCADARIAEPEEPDRLVPTRFGRVGGFHSKLLHLEQGERTLQQRLREVRLELRGY